MIRARSLESHGDLCCLPSPYRIPQSVAGMAFNFSKVEITPHAARRKAAAQTGKPREAAPSVRVPNPGACFGLPQYSPAT
jgi:hypothetical protein